MLMTAGLQVPVTPFGEVVANVGTVLPEQKVKGVTLKFGVMLFVMVTFKVTEDAHCPELGVKT